MQPPPHLPAGQRDERHARCLLQGEVVGHAGQPARVASDELCKGGRRGGGAAGRRGSTAGPQPALRSAQVSERKAPCSRRAGRWWARRSRGAGRAGRAQARLHRCLRGWQGAIAPGCGGGGSEGEAGRNELAACIGAAAVAGHAVRTASTCLLRAARAWRPAKTASCVQLFIAPRAHPLGRPCSSRGSEQTPCRPS